MISKETFISIPSSAFLFHVCPHLSPFDLLNLRLVSKHIHNLLQKEEDSERFWQLLLLRDFGVDVTTTENWNEVLNVQFPNPRATPIFGVDPADEKNFLLQIKTGPFDVWRHWLKVDGRVLPFGPSSSDLRKGGTFIHAPFYLRAAKFWRGIFKWCDAQDKPSHFGKEIRNSFETAFEWHRNTLDRLRKLGDIPKTSSRMAILAVYAFTSGQEELVRSLARFHGLLGGYHGYGYYSSMSLTHPAENQTMGLDQHLVVARAFLGQQQGVEKLTAVDLETGSIVAVTNGSFKHRICFSSPNENPHCQLSIAPPQQDDFLRYLEEYERRLTTGQYRIDTLCTNPDGPISITLFPQFPLRPGSQPISGPSSIPVVSRAVTRGIEVVGSAIYSREGHDDIGFVYCIRVRLLKEGEEGFQSESERGFSTCQLQSRHWRITNDSEQHVSHVNGQGVVGMYPILREGGYSLQGDHFVKGTFQYQSYSGPLGHTGSLGGQLCFVPGHLQRPAGPPFMVELNPFLLDKRPTFLY